MLPGVAAKDCFYALRRLSAWFIVGFIDNLYAVLCLWFYCCIVSHLKQASVEGAYTFC